MNTAELTMKFECNGRGPVAVIFCEGSDPELRRKLAQAIISRLALPPPGNSSRALALLDVADDPHFAGQKPALQFLYNALRGAGTICKVWQEPGKEHEVILGFEKSI